MKKSFACSPESRWPVDPLVIHFTSLEIVRLGSRRNISASQPRSCRMRWMVVKELLRHAESSSLFAKESVANG